MKMKRAKKFVFLIGGLVLVLAGYMTLSHVMTAESAKDADASVSVATVDTSAVSEISWSYNGKAVTLVKSGDSWSDKDDKTFPLDQSFPASMLSAVSDVKASRALTETAALSDYGLDQPFCTITLLTSDGNKTKFLLGNQNAVSEEYYMLLDDGDTVYMVGDSLVSAFSYRLDDLLAMDQIPNIADAQSFAIEKANGAVQLIYKESGEGITYTDSYQWFFVKDDGSLTPVSTDKTKALEDNVSNLQWVKCVDYHAAAGELASYGLDQPQAEVTVAYQETVDVDTGKKDKDGNAVKEQKEYDRTFDLLLGNETGDDYYAKLKDSQMIYEVNATVAKALLSASYASLQPDDVCLMDWDTVDSLDVTIDGKSITIGFDRTKTTDQDGKAEETASYQVDGGKGDTERVNAFLDGILALQAKDHTDHAPSDRAPEVKIVFHRNTQTFQTMTLALSQYDANRYLVDFNGQSRLLVNQDDVNALKEAFLAIK